MPEAAGARGLARPAGPAAPGRNSYDYRLVVSRKLYDRAIGTAMSPSLAPLTTPSTAHINPLDLAGLGVTDGTDVQVIGSRGTVVLPLDADRAVPRGSLRVPFNVPGASIADIIDARAAANDVRVERM